jgi:hypothetical protein
MFVAFKKIDGEICGYFLYKKYLFRATDIVVLFHATISIKRFFGFCLAVSQGADSLPPSSTLM